jgi:hypothetical protein
VGFALIRASVRALGRRLRGLPCPKFLHKLGKAPLFDGRPHTAHQHLVKVQIVDTVKPRAQDFRTPVQVPQVSAGVMPAGVALAAFVQRPRVALVLGITNLDDAGGRE